MGKTAELLARPSQGRLGPESRQQWGHSYQRRHVSSVHLTTGNLLLGRWHAAHLEIFRTRGSGAHDGRQGHGAMLHLPHPVTLLLKDC